MFDSVAIVGVGLIGGSFALSLKERGLVKNVIGVGNTASSINKALELGLIDEMVAPDGVYDAAAAWASRFVDGPRSAFAAAKAGIDDVYALPPAERWDAERRRYLHVFADSLRRPAIEAT